MPDKLLKHGLISSRKVGSVTEFAELLFVRLILATCHAGRCPWNPDWIRTHALPNRPRTRLTSIAAALESLRSAHLVARYIAPDGTPYLLIPNHGQRLRHTVRSPWPAPPSGPPDADGQVFMAIPGLEEEEKRRGEGARGRALPAPPEPAAVSGARAAEVVGGPQRKAWPKVPAAAETDEEWLARVEREWPGVNVRAELAKAHRKKPDLERGWFERVWLPGVTPKAPRAVSSSLLPPASSALPEPPGWRTALEELYPENLINRDQRPWTAVSPGIQAEVCRHITRAA